MARITTVDPDDNGLFTINFECEHSVENVTSPIACGLGQGDEFPCDECGDVVEHDPWWVGDN